MLRGFPVLVFIFGTFLTIGCCQNGQLANDGENMSQKNINEIAEILKGMLEESHQCYTIGCFDETERLRGLVKDFEKPWQYFQPIESFFLFEATPDLIESADRSVLAASYSSALMKLTSNWWGPPGSPDGAAADHLLAIPNITSDLMPLLKVQTPLSYHGSEISTMNEMFGWTVADLAGGFIAELRGEAYPFREELDVRILYQKGLLE